MTHRDFESSFHVNTGHEGILNNGVSVINYEKLAIEGYMVFLTVEKQAILYIIKENDNECYFL